MLASKGGFKLRAGQERLDKVWESNWVSEMRTAAMFVYCICREMNQFFFVCKREFMLPLI